MEKRKKKIKDLCAEAKTLRHNWIVTDVLKDGSVLAAIDLDDVRCVIDRIREIERDYTDAEIADQNLLFDIW